MDLYKLKNIDITQRFKEIDELNNQRCSKTIVYSYTF